jgi:hypothetical protein
MITCKTKKTSTIEKVVNKSIGEGKTLVEYKEITP